MGKELVISANRHETKVAVLEDGQLVEIYFQRANEYSLAGSIHKGRVTRVLPGMQSAFVDVGLDRDAFLYVSDFFEENEEYDKIAAPDDRGRRGERERLERERIERERAERVDRTEPAEPAPAEEKVEELPIPEHAAEPDGRDRKGRRSRRRRNRGRGFPESKYAPEPSVSWSPKEPEVQESAAAIEPLPGESLAKYRREEAGNGTILELAGAEEADATQINEPEAAGLVDPVPDAENGAAILEEPLAPEPAETQFEASEAEALIEETEDPANEAPEDAMAEDPGVVEPQEPATVEEPVSESEPESEPAADDAPVETALESEPDEDTAEAAVPETEEPSPALTAGVREREGRYPHRVSRRLRRKMRNAGPEPRDEEHAEPKAEARASSQPSESPRQLPSITDLLREGQEVLVQVAKEPLGQKGARITSHIALPGRYVVYMPTVEHLGVSRKIGSDEERQRLRRILMNHRVGIPGGFIVRTAGTGRSEQEIASDMTFLYNLWLDIRQRAERKPAPTLIHHDLDLVQRLLRDQLTESFKAIWVDHEDIYESVLRFVERLQPAMVGRVKMYTRPTPIFDAFGVTAELEKALRPKVWLRSGGYIVINQTEALVAVDVNTGKFVGKSARLEDTIVKTNTEAIKEIVRQIRLRDLGGIIVIDFIDMDERKNRQKVMQALEEEMRFDRAPYKILQFNDFGLVAITRKRVKQTLERALCSPCPTCDGSGYVKSVQTVIGEILQEAQKIARAVEGPNVVLRVNPEVAKVLKSTDNDYLEELEEILRYPVLVTGDPELHPEKFDLA
ncbi:MAG TPA: Rne/Rng family ribonuclease [Bryobacteraceae bacterium]|nr:Rne/Rng family ribonuclease [Bryobacteraceae bacterium]